MKGTVFVAGATGAVGMPLARMLVQAGWRVFGSTRRPERGDALREAGVEPVVVDVFDAPALESLLRSIRPDVVVHQLTDLPAIRSPESMTGALERNARLRREGTRNLVEATVAAGCRRLVAQSIAWAYAPGVLPHDEDAPLELDAKGERLVTVAAVHDLESQVLNTPGLNGVVLRYASLYGPRTWYSRPQSPMALHVDDAARAALLAVERSDAMGAFNISEPCPELSVDKAARELGWRATGRGE